MASVDCSAVGRTASSRLDCEVFSFIRVLCSVLGGVVIGEQGCVAVGVQDNAVASDLRVAVLEFGEQQDNSTKVFRISLMK